MSSVAVTACPVCGGTAWDPFGTRSDGVAVRRCRRCGMGVVSERPTDLLALYDDAYYDGAAGAGAGYEQYRAVAAHSLPWAADLVRLLQPSGRVLDVGAADGTLLRLLEDGDYERYAIEVNERLLAELVGADIRPLARDLFDPGLAAHRGTFDAVTAIAVLEHVADIRGAVERIRGLLAPDGWLLFEVPLLTGGDDDAIWYASSLEHVLYPTEEGLRFLFETAFGLPLLGRAVCIRGFGNTFVGVATASPARHAALAARLAALLDGPVEALATPLERAFRFDFEVVHAADPGDASLALLPWVDPSRIDAHLLARLAALWQVDRDRASSDQALAADSLRAAAERESALARELTEAVRQRSRVEGTLVEQNAYLERVRTDLAAETARAERLGSELSSAVERGRRLDVELEDHRARASELEGRIASREAELAEARGKVAALALLSLEGERLREQLVAIHDSRLWRVAVRYWRLRDAARAPFALLGPAAAAGLRGAGSGLARALRVVPKGAGWGPARAAFRRLPVRDEVKDRWMRRTLGVGYTGPIAPEPDPSLEPHEPLSARRPLVTVVIPSFNYGAFVTETVDSVLAQTLTDVEILVVHSGSHQPTLRVLGELERPRTKVLLREHRHLVGDNRNYGIQRARGRYVCCLDSDDLLRPTYLEKAVYLLEEHGFDVVSTSIDAFGGESRVYHVNVRPTLADMLEGNHIPTCAVFRKEWWERAGGFVDTGTGEDHVHEDWRLFQRMVALGARVYNIVEEPLFRYRVHDGSLSSALRTAAARDQQRQVMRELNADVIDEAALERSEELARVYVRRTPPLVNLGPRMSRSGAQPTVLLAMPFLLLGGAERLLSEIVRHLSAQGVRIVLATTLPADPSSGDTTKWFQDATAEIYHLPRFLEPGAWKDFACYLAVTRKPDVLWIVGSVLFYELLPELKSRLPGLAVVDLLFNTVGHTANNRRFQKQIDLTVVENAEVERWLLDAGESAARVRRIESGVDLERYRPRSDPRRRAELGIPPDGIVVGFSGRLSEEKAPEVFLEVAELLRDDERLHFLMTGDGPLGGLIRERLSAPEANPRSRLLGQLEDVRDALALYDVLVLPSRLDGRPVVVLEALAMGVPVVGSRVGDLPRLVQDGRTGFLCPPGDASAFARRLRELAARPDLRREMSLAARRFAEAELDARRMLEHYEETLSVWMR